MVWVPSIGPFLLCRTRRPGGQEGKKEGWWVDGEGMGLSLQASDRGFWCKQLGGSRFEPPLPRSRTWRCALGDVLQCLKPSSRPWRLKLCAFLWEQAWGDAWAALRAVLSEQRLVTPVPCLPGGVQPEAHGFPSSCKRRQEGQPLAQQCGLLPRGGGLDEPLCVVPCAVRLRALLYRMQLCRSGWPDPSPLNIETSLFFTSLELSPMDNIRFPWWLSGKESSCQCRRRKFDPWVRKIPFSMKW